MAEGGFLASGGLSSWHWLLVFALFPVPGVGWLLLPAILVLVFVAAAMSGPGLAVTLVLLFFLPPATVYGWWRARRIATHQKTRQFGFSTALGKAIALPAVVGLGLAVALAERALDEGRQLEGLLALRGLMVADPLPSTLYTGRALVDGPLAVLGFIGNAALILFFLSIPFVLGGAISVILLVLDRFGAPLGLAEARADPIQSEEVPVSDHSFVLAIDGPAAAGKGTLAKRLAAHYGLPYLDTGLLYRAVGRRAVEEGADLDDPVATGEVARSLAPSALDDGTLRGREAGELASRVAVHPPVRAALVAFQRDFAARAEGAVLDGRDIGTVICPDAPVKIFVTASPEVRARRRTDELAAKGRAPDYERILAEVRERDARDSGRADAPLRPASDAHLLDTSEMTIEEAFRAACDLVDRARATGTEA